MSGYTHSGDCSTSEPCPRCFEFGQTTAKARIIQLLETYALRECDEWCAAGCECYAKYEAMHLIERIREGITEIQVRKNRICLNYFEGNCNNEAGGLSEQWCDPCYNELIKGENK